MCRLFGFRSITTGQVHQSLVHAENALTIQSHEHPDGWGLAYYILNSPHVIRSKEKAINDTLFSKVSGIVSSQTVLAHVRTATLGGVDILNTHPFQFGHWVFAHNGNIKDFDKLRSQLLNLIDPYLKQFILGTTDSEILFYILLSEIKRTMSLEDECRCDLLSQVIKESIKKICDIIGPYTHNNNAPNSETFLTFILTNGEVMIAHQGGKDLFYSTYKKKCHVSETCSFYKENCEAPSKDGFVNHLVFASEPLNDNNIWIKMNPGEIRGIDCQMKLFSF